MKFRAFTLVELLVGVSIVSVLVALLMPVLKSAKEGAQAAQCTSNLRQLSIANLSCAADQGGRFVMAQDPTNLIRWHGVRSSTSAAFDPTKGPLSPYLGAEGRVKICPTFRDALEGAKSFEQGTGGYGYNATYIGGRPSDFYGPERIQNVPRPATTIMFTDTAFARADGIQEYAYCEPFEWVDSSGKLAGALSASVHFRHRGFANIGWCDGHVTAETPSRIDGTNYYGGDSSKWKIGWLGPSKNNGYWNPQADVIGGVSMLH